MNVRSVRCLAILAAMFAARAAMAQDTSPDLRPDPSASSRIKESESNFPGAAGRTKPTSAKTPAQANFSKTRFILFSAAVYAASIADMHQTLDVRENSWWHETDPLAKPLVRFPALAYYATGLAMATGVNWLNWEMARSHRWRKLAPIPQIFSITGNLYGFHSNRF
jgi:hypothetical protein